MTPNRATLGTKPAAHGPLGTLTVKRKQLPWVTSTILEPGRVECDTVGVLNATWNRDFHYGTGTCKIQVGLGTELRVGDSGPL